MRNMIRADLRRVFRKQIFWIIPLIALLFGLSTMISMLAVEFLSKIIPQLGLLAQQKNAALASINTVMDSLKLALSIVIFLALFVDDLVNSMAMQLL